MTAPTTLTGMTGMYYQQHWPLSLVTLLNELIANQQQSPNTPLVSTLPMLRVWFSQPRPGNDPTGEVLTVNFKLPVAIGEFSIEVLRVPCVFEVWYQDRNNNWIAMPDENYQPMRLNLSSSQDVSWFKWHVYTYPIVARAIQFRITRKFDPVLGNQPYNIGLRKGLARRNIYHRSQGVQAMGDEQDALGNVITKYVQDWGATDAIDDNPYTFWRSEPLPDPAAVASLYLNLANPDGSPQLVAGLNIDPIYINQNLNVYYSIDDTTGTPKLSPTSLPPDTDDNTLWTAGKGLVDIADPGESSTYQFPLSWGPLLSQDCWVGVEWTPNFDAGDGPASNPILLGVSPGRNAVQTVAIVGITSGGHLQLSVDGINYTATIAWNATAAAVQTAVEALTAVGAGNVLVVGDAGGPWSLTFRGALAQQAVPTMKAIDALTGSVPQPTVSVQSTTGGYPPPNPGADQFWPVLYYDVGAGEIVLELTNGTVARTYTAALSPALTKNAPLRIVAGWSYTPATVFLSVAAANGAQLATLTSHPTDLPTQITLDGEMGYANFAGTMRAMVVKLENFAAGQAAFQSNPAMYVNPNPVVPDPNSGIVPSTTLDNAILAADWTLQNLPYGGGDASVYENKVWTPVFANYITQKGKFYFPQPVRAKYLKLEFTNLTEESYPVYDSGIKVVYQTFPISVTQSVTPRGGSSPLDVVSGLLSWGGQPGAGGIGSVNWLNPKTINAAVNSAFGYTTTPISVQVGPGTVSTSLPNTSGSTAAATTVEQGTPWVYRRPLPSTSVLASQQICSYGSGAKGGGSQPQPPSVAQQLVNSITNQFTPLVTFSPSSTSLPLQGSDWWVVPGQTTILAAHVMTGHTQGTQVVFRRKPSTVWRLRFTATCVHQYQLNTAVRDASLAYFAGVREVSAFVTNYLPNQDPFTFTFSPYDPQQWVFNNVEQLDTGPITTKSLTYQIQNPLFDTTLDEWTQVHGEWSIDPGMGKWEYGAATVIADGTEKLLLSHETTCWPQVTPGANFTVQVWVQWRDVTSTGTPIVLSAHYYQDDTYLSQETATHAASGENIWTTGGEGGVQITLSGTVPVDTNRIYLGLGVSAAATAGQFWFDTVTMTSADLSFATTYIDLITQSTFVKVNCVFHDSGLVRSDDMWANIDPNNTNISPTALAWYTSTIPDVIPSGTWGDTMAKWADPTTTWGMPFSPVKITIDPNMIFNGKRFLHFYRDAGAEEAGIKVRQVTGWVRNALFRIGLIYYKPYANTNQITFRLRRLSDGVYIYEESITPKIGSVVEYWTNFQEIPDSPDQIYELECVLFGDDADEMYINDLYCDVTQIRYFIRLGGEDAFLHDCTQLAYTDEAVVATTTPVNEISIQGTILAPTAFMYSASITPNYLK